jgi:hypothetical protein
MAPVAVLEGVAADVQMNLVVAGKRIRSPTRLE